ncbi:MAG: ABC transporter permease [Propionibacteriaceae bacterium]|nr:ABC transporter permease [Propionibacteriaceae bacterium]
MSLSWNGIRTVADLELRQRIRSKRWIIALIAWFVFIGLITGIIIYSIHYSWAGSGCDPASPYSYCPPPAGPIAFSIITMFVLGMGLVIAPTFTATSINGDRNQSTLATLQATRLSALEIATGKLIAAWLTAGVFLVVALPFAILSMVLGGISAWQVAVCFLVTFILVGIVCAIGLGWSAILSRAAGSTVMTYLSTVVLTVITPLLLLFSFPFIEDTQYTVQVWGVSDQVRDDYIYATNQFWNKNQGEEVDYSQAPDPPIDQCHWTTQRVSETRIDKVWWLILPNPFVIVADASPLPPAAKEDLSEYSDDALSLIRYLVREMAQAPQTERDECLELYNYSPKYFVEYNNDGTRSLSLYNGEKVDLPDSPVKVQPVTARSSIWPWGLGFDLLLGGLFFGIAVRKLTIPYKTLARGTRVA